MRRVRVSLCYSIGVRLFPTGGDAELGCATIPADARARGKTALSIAH